MATDVFGNLSEWGDVLGLLTDLREAGELDEHQDGLARLIRYQDNWRLREEALISAAQVRMPGPSLVAATLKLLANQEESLENRILAARALGSMLVACQSHANGQVDVAEAVASLEGLVNQGGPPVLQAAMQSASSMATGAGRCSAVF